MPRKSEPQKPPEQPKKPAADMARILRAWKFQAAGPEYAEASMLVLKSAGALTRQGYLEMMLQIESLYPGRGWREAMDDLERFYHDHKLSLKQYPVSRSIGLSLPQVAAKTSESPENEQAFDSSDDRESS